MCVFPQITPTLVLKCRFILLFLDIKSFIKKTSALLLYPKKVSMSLDLNKKYPNIDYYYSDENGHTLGPFILENLLPKINKDTLVYRDGINWTNADRIDELKKYFNTNDSITNANSLTNENLKVKTDQTKKIIKGSLVIFGLLSLIIALKYLMSSDFKTSKVSIETKKDIQPSYQNKSTENSPNLDLVKFRQASDRVLTAVDIAGFSRYELKIMRNEIYARYGYIFKSKEMRNYFTAQSWYSPRYSDVSSFLSETEKKNIELIKRYE
jgi:hypothetical protein